MSNFRFLLDDEVVKVKPSSLSTEEVDKSYREELSSNTLNEVDKLKWHYYEESQEYVAEINFKDKKELGVFLSESIDFLDAIYTIKSEANKLELYIYKDNKELFHKLCDGYGEVTRSLY
jgi:hypothetical protein